MRPKTYIALLVINVFNLLVFYMSSVLVELEIYKAFSHDAHADLMLHYLHKKQHTTYILIYA